MATILQKGLLGYDPVELRLQEQKQWSNLYAQAQNPYEKMGIALGQIGGALFGGETTAQSQVASLNTIVQEAAQKFTPNSSDYFKYIASALPDSMADSKTRALTMAAEAKTKEDAVFNESSKNISDRPDTYNVLAAPLADSLIAKAELNGYDKSTPLPTTSKEITAFAKEYGLTKDPMYGKLLSLTKIYETAVEDKTRKTEKETLSIEQIKANIAKSNEDLKKIKRDDFDKGTRWNEENAAARAFLIANKIDISKPLTGAAKANPAFVEAYQKALRNDWTGSKGITTPAPKDTGKPASQGGDMQQQVTAAWGSYDPAKYDYQIVNGKVLRALK